VKRITEFCAATLRAWYIREGGNRRIDWSNGVFPYGKPRLGMVRPRLKNTEKSALHREQERIEKR
jgi:hypothetical protein